jgi:hypothetical protein
MRNHTVEISDNAGHAFKMAISTVQSWGHVKDTLAGNDQKAGWVPMTGMGTRSPDSDPRAGQISSWDQVPGTWRAIDKGFIRYSSGKLIIRNSHNGDITTRDIVLMNLDGTWGMQMWEYEDVNGVNDQGQGAVNQPWVVGFPPGKFSWVVID